MKSLATIVSLKKNSRIAMISIIVFILLLFIDFYVSSVTDVANGFVQSAAGNILFVTLMVLSLFGGSVVISSIWKIIGKKKSVFSRYKILFRVMQILLYSLSVILMLDIIFNHKYYTINLTSIVVISYGSSIIMSLFISFKMFSWYKDNKNKFSFLFGLAIFFLFVNNLVSIILFATLLSEKSFQIDSTTPAVFNFECTNDSLYCLFKEGIVDIQSYTLMIYFALFWICNYFLLHYHIKKIGKNKFLVLVTVPLVFFFFAFIYHYDELYSFTKNMNFDESIVFMLQIFIVMFSIALCVVLYGLGFKSVANLLKMSPQIERYLIIASYGIILFFVCANSSIAGASFPPFGIPSIIFLPFASLLFYVGIYYSITAISNDIRVRKYIKKSAYKELEIIGDLAKSQMIDNMKVKVLAMTKKYSEEIHQKSESETMETEEDLKSYLDDAISIFNKSHRKQI